MVPDATPIAAIHSRGGMLGALKKKVVLEWMAERAGSDEEVLDAMRDKVVACVCMCVSVHVCECACV